MSKILAFGKELKSARSGSLHQPENSISFNIYRLIQFNYKAADEGFRKIVRKI